MWLRLLKDFSEPDNYNKEGEDIMRFEGMNEYLTNENNQENLVVFKKRKALVSATLLFIILFTLIVISYYIIGINNTRLSYIVGAYATGYWLFKQVDNFYNWILK